MHVPQILDRDTLRYLQSTVGNQRVVQLLGRDGNPTGSTPPPTQAKLAVGAANDRYEREADRIANQVAAAQSTHAARSAAPSPAKAAGPIAKPNHDPRGRPTPNRHLVVSRTPNKSIQRSLWNPFSWFNKRDISALEGDPEEAAVLEPLGTGAAIHDVILNATSKTGGLDSTAPSPIALKGGGNGPKPKPPPVPKPPPGPKPLPGPQPGPPTPPLAAKESQATPPNFLKAIHADKVIGGLNSLGGVATTLGGGIETMKGIGSSFGKGKNRFERNVGALRLDSGLGKVGSGLANIAPGFTDMIGVSDNIPILDVVANSADAIIKGKKAIEDTATFGRLLHHQRRTGNVQEFAMDEALDDRAKQARLDQFKRAYQNFQTSRYKKVEGAPQQFSASPSSFSPLAQTPKAPWWDRALTGTSNLVGKQFAGVTDRWSNVSALADAKNRAKYGGKENRGFGWKLKQFLRPGKDAQAQAAGFNQAVAAPDKQRERTSFSDLLSIGWNKQRNFKSGDIEKYEALLADQSLTEEQRNAQVKQLHLGLGDKNARTALEREYKTKRNRLTELSDKRTRTPAEETEKTKLESEMNTRFAKFAGFRTLGKANKFAAWRKGESATLNTIEATGHAADAIGTFTAAGDLGITKTVGKGLKAGSALWKGGRNIYDRAKRVHNLRQAKNAAKLGGKDNRGVLWGAKQYFFGNLDKQSEKLREAIEEGKNKTGYVEKTVAPTATTPFGPGGSSFTPTPAGPQANFWQKAGTGVMDFLSQQAAGVGDRWRDISALAQAKNAAKYGGKEKRGLGWKLKQFLRPGRDATRQAKSFNEAVGSAEHKVVKNPGKTFDVGDKKSKIRHDLMTKQERRAEDLINALKSPIPEVRQRAIQTYKILAETNLAGATNRLLRGGIQDTDFADLGSDTPLAKSKAKAIEDLYKMQTTI